MPPKVRRNITLMLIWFCGVALGLLIPRMIEKAHDFDAYTTARESAENKEEFDRNFDNMVIWFDNYKKEHPEATKEEAEQAFRDLWKK